MYVSRLRYEIGFLMYGASTCVRIAFKAFQMQSFGFSLCKIDLTKGTLAESQKVKFDKMKAWPDSPFLEYTCRKPHRNRNVYAIEKKNGKLPCVGCSQDRANKKCCFNMCKACCVKHCASNYDISLCKEKGHAVAATKARLASNRVEAEEGMEVVEEEEGAD